MTLPNYLANGFDFDEAISLVELCQRAQQVLAHAAGSDAKDLYNLLFKDDEWVCVHATEAKAQAQALILHRTATTQFVLVFNEPETHSVKTAQATASGGDATSGATPSTAQTAMPTIPVINLAITNKSLPSVDPRETANSVEYSPLLGEAAPPPRGARVHEPRLRALAALQEDIELFFNTLVDVKLAQPDKAAPLISDLTDLGQRELPGSKEPDSPKGEHLTTSLTTIGDALALKFGPKVSKTALKALAQGGGGMNAGKARPQKTEEVTDTPTDTPDQLLAQALVGQTVLVDVAPGIDLYVTGHRRGGCLAALCVLYLKRRWETQLDFPLFNLKMYSFGSPKIGNKSFVDYYNRNLQGFSVCVQNLMDRATYEPTVQAPFPYNLQLQLPGIDYVRCPGSSGDEYLTAYQPIEEAYQLPGIGYPTQEFNFLRGFRSLIPLPYAHDVAGYKAMLEDTYAFQRTWQASTQQVMGVVNEQKDQLLARVTKQAGAVQKAITQLQGKSNG